MKVLDANVRICAYNIGSPQHGAARRWVERTLSSPEPVGIPLRTVTAFLRVTTHRRLLKSRLSIDQAIAIVESWLTLPHVRLLLPTERHGHLPRQMLLEGGALGDLVTDAQMTAAAIEAGAVLMSNDRDFSCFPGLRWENPLADK